MFVKKLIVTLLVLVPAIAFAGGSFDPEQQMAQKTIVIENHVPADDGNGVIYAAIIAGAFALAGTVVAVRKKS
jgi:hypothetical protein